jgi:hypothetical protein
MFRMSEHNLNDHVLFKISERVIKVSETYD